MKVRVSHVGSIALSVSKKEIRSKPQPVSTKQESIEFAFCTGTAVQFGTVASASLSLDKYGSWRSYTDREC